MSDSPRLSDSPDFMRTDEGVADNTHPRAIAFTVVNHRCVLTTPRTHPFIFNALKRCMESEPSATKSILLEFGISAYPGLPMEEDIRWFRQIWTGDYGRLRELTASGRVWRRVKIEGEFRTVLSFWPNRVDVLDTDLALILSALDLLSGPQIFVEYTDSVSPRRYPISL